MKKKISTVVLFMLAFQAFIPLYASAGSDIVLSIESVGDRLDITGAGAGANTFVGLKMILPGGNAGNKEDIYTVRETLADSNGAFRFSFSMGVQADSGIYVIFANDAKGRKSDGLKFSFVNGKMRKSFVDTVNAGDKTAVSALLSDGTKEPVISAMGIMIGGYSGLNAANRDMVCGQIIQKRPDGTEKYDENTLISVINEAIVTGLINQTKNSGETGAIVKSYSKLLIENPIYQLYFAETNDDKGIVSGGVFSSKEYSGIDALRAKLYTYIFVEAVDYMPWAGLEKIIVDFKDVIGLDITGEYAGMSPDEKTALFKKMADTSLTTPQAVINLFNLVIKDILSKRGQAAVFSPVGSGGRGVAAVRTVPLPQIPVMPAPEVKKYSIPPRVSQREFSDISRVLWAQEAIRELASRNIVEGVGNGFFEPESFVTREQYIKMIISAFSLPDSEARVDFIDVPTDSWSYPYIAAAKKAGIISGVSETEFAPQSLITRQDAALILYNLVNYMDINLTPEDSADEFNDMAEISSYAREAVLYMLRTRIMNGMGGGSFAPKEACTRAQAAKIIYGLINNLVY
jgi:hypothetical protein